jgi:hypothetical protein
MNKCGCNRKTCDQLAADCGTPPDGCGGKLDCGKCPAGKECGMDQPYKCSSMDD